MSEIEKPHVLTMSGPGKVRLELHVNGSSLWVEDTSDAMIGTAWCLLDSAKRSFEKAKKPVPDDIVKALKILQERSPA